MLLGPLALISGFLILVAARRRRRGESDRPTAGPSPAPERNVAPGRGAAATLRVPVPAVLGAVTAAVVDETMAIQEELAAVDEDAPLEQTRRAMQNSKPIVASGATAVARTFEKPPRKGVERARVGYRRVRIGSEPVDVGSTELGRLDRGDEIEILGSHEGFLRIRTPDDITGWILRHVIVGSPSS